jgi:protein SCO1
VKRAACVFAVLVLAGCGGASKPALRGNELTQRVAAPNFALQDQAGKTVTMAAQRGHWTVVTFLYTHCPDVCPLIAASLNGALKDPAGGAARLHVLAVSVDPARDTLAAVRTYAVQHRLAPAFRFLIGTQAQLERVWSAYHVAALPGPKGTVTHSTFSMLIDPQGQERVLYDATITTDDLVHDLGELT